MREKKFGGVVVPTVTPFTDDGKIDIKGVENIIEHIVSNNSVDEIIPEIRKIVPNFRNQKDIVPD